tara:strand:+ start:699 stop:1445 length:747 start_codon:yes stop_codon:yes gene_type:complete
MINNQLDKHNEKYSNYLKGKNVAIVGPSESAFFDKNGDYIDSFDVVVRINRGIELLPGKEIFLGNKTNILYNSLDFNIYSGGELKGIDNIEFICCPYSKSEETYNESIFTSVGSEKSLFSKYNIRFINPKLYTSWQTKSKSRINSGFGAIIDLLDHDIKSLFITGIDFYRSFYHENYCKERNRSRTVKAIEDELEFKVFNDQQHHNPDRQYACFKEIVKSDSRVILDPFLNKIVTDNRYDNWDTIPRD